MRFLNLTPHTVNIHTNGEVVNIAPDGPAPRLETIRTELPAIDGIPLQRVTLGRPTGLPDKQEDTLLIVSAMIAEHPSLSDRDDLVYPGELVRDENGVITGCNGLSAGTGMFKTFNA